ncbi:MAG: hypothetical protein Q9O24_06795 [Gammaproteobacteria bacterium]|nr:hypothetical protein [Gammaproteobacteria bacterium]
MSLFLDEATVSAVLSDYLLLLARSTKRIEESDRFLTELQIQNAELMLENKALLKDRKNFDSERIEKIKNKHQELVKKEAFLTDKEKHLSTREKSLNHEGKWASKFFSKKESASKKSICT